MFREKTRYNSGSAGIAQLVERNLAKVEVASSSLVSRSKLIREATASLFRQKHGAIAKRLCTGLQIRLAQFDSGSRLQISYEKSTIKPREGLFVLWQSQRQLLNLY